MPAQTMTKASSVPIEHKLPASRTLRMPAKKATPTPVTMVVIHGVRNFGCTRWMNGGSRPSRDIAQNTRDCPKSMTSTTELKPRMAPTLMTPPSHFSPA